MSKPSKNKGAAPPDVKTLWPAAEVFLWPIEKLIPHARNARVHSDEQIEQIAASMREFGWVNPVLIDELGLLIAGHGRVLAAPKLGWKEAPVMIARGWSEAKKRAYMLIDNKLALNSDWDSNMLLAELEALRDEQFPAAFLGFSDDEIKRLTDDVSEQAYEALGSEAGDGSTEVDRPALEPGQVALTIPLTVQLRSIIFEAIGVAKREYQLDQAGEALCQICRNYLKLVGPSAPTEQPTPEPEMAGSQT